MLLPEGRCCGMLHIALTWQAPRSPLSSTEENGCELAQPKLLAQLSSRRMLIVNEASSLHSLGVLTRKPDI